MSGRSEVPRCRFCGRLVIWAKTMGGRPMPVIPKRGGDIEVTGDADDPIAWTVGEGRGRYENHAKACQERPQRATVKRPPKVIRPAWNAR